MLFRSPQEKPKEVKPAPRMPDGKPDLRGIWNLRSDGRFFGLRTPEMARNRQEVAVTEAEEALTPAAREKYKDRLQRGKVRTIERDLLDPTIKACAPPGPSRTIQRGIPFEVIQIPGRVILRYEMEHWVRDVWMDGRQHPKDAPPTWMGHSIGWWDGDSLVVETVGVNDLTWLDSPGHPHSEAMKLTERYTRVNHDTLEIQLTFDDPETYVKPLASNKLTWRLMPEAEIAEWVACEDRLHINLETDVCKITGAWEFEAYCNRRNQGSLKKEPQQTGTPPIRY